MEKNKSKCELFCVGSLWAGRYLWHFYSKYPEKVRTMILAYTLSGFSRETAEIMLSQK